MSASRAWQKLRDLEASPEFLALREREFPYRSVALAVVDLRGRLGLTQGQLADRVGTSQSVISRLESGRHPVEVTLLARIAQELGEPLHLEFGRAAALATVSPDLAIAAEVVTAYPAPPVSGDDALDRFNAANTTGDFAAAHQIALEIAVDPSTPRRKLALALDAYNRRQHADAARWAADALREGLPPTSTDTAALVQGRSLIHLERARQALRVLGQIGPASHLGWLAPAAMADAYVELRDATKATRESDRALRLARGEPEARYHAARTLWHADRIWQALDHISIYRAAQPDNSEGLILHGSILGFIASRDGDRDAYEAALTLFAQALPSGDCEAIRLYAMTAARMGRWREAFRKARRLVSRTGWSAERCQHAQPEHDHAHAVRRHILPDAFEGLGEADPSELELATDEAERLFGPSEEVAAHRALARALRGDVDGALASLGRTLETLGGASAREQVAIAAAYYVRRDFARAFDILRRCRDDLTRPEGLLRLAECATAIGEIDEARAVIEYLSRGEDTAADVARTAVGVIRAEHAAARRARVDVVGERWMPLSSPPEQQAPRESPWEGKHHRLTPMLESLPNRARLN